jgi:tRNA 2-thiouridine synthesizing protein E
MTQLVSNAQDFEIFSLYDDICQPELIAQKRNREKSADLAQNEGISLTDEHWILISCSHNYYNEHGLPRFARTTARARNRKFSAQGGRQYSCSLFAGDPVTQGSRLANLRTPANATGVSFGTS